MGKENQTPNFLDLMDMDQNWTELGQIWIKRKLNPGPETRLKAQKFGFKARTKYSVYIHHLLTYACLHF